MNPVRNVEAPRITVKVREMFLQANICLDDDVEEALRRARDGEETETGRLVLERILENAAVAREERLPICQDTGLAVVFVELGQDVRVVGGALRDAIEEGVRQAYREGCFRQSVCDPLSRVNTGDNTPAVIHLEVVPGDALRLAVMPKGGGSENMSAVTMLLPTAGRDGIRDHVVETVLRAGPNPCPPVIVGVGIGGAMEEAALLAKRSLLRPLGEKSPDGRLALLEAEILTEINRRGGGPQGFGGNASALAVHVEMKPCHIACLPVAVNIQCHAARHHVAEI